MKTDKLPPGNVPGEARPALIVGLVLMGGQSTRMGRDKSALVYHGKPQRDYLTTLLVPFCDQIYWSVNETQAQVLTYDNLLVDRYPESGPLGGLVSAFDTHPTVAWLTVPCDLPNLDAATIDFLVTNRNETKLATAFWDKDRSGPEPLVSLWEPDAGPLLRTWFQSGNRSPRQFMAENPVTLLNVPDHRVFENVNDWEEYKKSSRQ